MRYVVSWTVEHSYQSEQGLVELRTRREAEDLILKLVDEQFEYQDQEAPAVSGDSFDDALDALAAAANAEFPRHPDFILRLKSNPWRGRIDFNETRVWFSEAERPVEGIDWRDHKLEVREAGFVDTSGGNYALMAEYPGHHVLITDGDAQIPGPHSDILVGVYEGTGEESIGESFADDDWWIMLDDYETVHDRDQALRDRLDDIQRRYG